MMFLGNYRNGTTSPALHKDLNLYRMSREDYEKAKKNEKDSTIVEIQLTTDGMKDFGYGMLSQWENI